VTPAPKVFGLKRDGQVPLTSRPEDEGKRIYLPGEKTTKTRSKKTSINKISERKRGASTVRTHHRRVETEGEEKENFLFRTRGAPREKKK